jgi:hypothetical protein
VKLSHPVYAIANPTTGDVIYSALAPSPKLAWDDVVDRELMGTGHTRKSLRAQGWRSVRIAELVLA